MPGAAHSALLMTYGGLVATFDGEFAPDSGDSTYNNVPTSRGPIKIIATHWYGGATDRNNSSCTVNGQSATRLVHDNHSGGITSLGCAIWIVDLGVDTTEIDVVLGWSGAIGNSHIGVFSVVGLDTIIPTDTLEVRGTNDTSISGTIDIPAGGFLIVAGTGSTNTDPYDMVLTGATQVYDGSDDFTGRYGGAVSNTLAAQTGRSVTLTMTDGVGDVDDSGTELMAVSFGAT